MDITIKYTPVGQNPKELTLVPPLVPDIVEFSKKTDYRATLPERCAKKLIAENPSIFSEVPFRLPNPFTKTDLAAINDLSKLDDIGFERFNVELDQRKGVTRLRAELLKLQDDALNAKEVKE